MLKIIWLLIAQLAPKRLRELAQTGQIAGAGSVEQSKRFPDH